MTEPVFLSGRDVLLCHFRAEHGMRAWIKPYFLGEAESKMFLSPWRISLAERQDACFVGVMTGDHPALSFSTFCWYILGRGCTKDIEAQLKNNGLFGQRKIQAFELQLLVFSPPFCSCVVIFGRMTLVSEVISSIPQNSKENYLFTPDFWKILSNAMY